jgi:hypothetical protein
MSPESEVPFNSLDSFYMPLYSDDEIYEAGFSISITAFDSSLGYTTPTSALPSESIVD